MRDKIDVSENNPVTGNQERHPFDMHAPSDVSEELLENDEHAKSHKAAVQTGEEMTRIAQRLKDEKRN